MKMHSLLPRAGFERRQARGAPGSSRTPQGAGAAGDPRGARSPPACPPRPA